MQKLLFAFLLSFFLLNTNKISAQYFQQEVAYDISAELDSSKHVLSANCDITYTNKSNEELDTIFLHLWANAFSDKVSAFSNQSIRMGQLEFYFAKEKDMGGYKNLAINVGEKRMTVYSWQGNSDVVYFLPSKSVKSGETIKIETAFDLKIPHKFSRMGRTNQDYYLMYWYPSPAVFDQEGWHPMPYLNMGETYSEIADFEIDLKSPVEAIISSVPSNGNYGTNKMKYQAKDIIDFALVISKNKKIFKDVITTKRGNTIDISFMSKYQKRDSSARVYLKEALDYYEPLIGDFPYASLSILDKGKKSTSGMEYPGLITVSGADDEEGNFEYYLVHELLHQWFYSALAFNQRDHAWLDEGLTTYYQQRYYKETKGIDHYSKKGAFVMFDNQQPLLHSAARGQACRHYHIPLNSNVQNIDPANYGFNAYEIPARMWAYLADYVGKSNFDKAMNQFYLEWKGAHPQPEDLQSQLEKTSGKDLLWFFEDLINKDWSYDYSVEKISNNQVFIKHLSGSNPPYKLTFKSKDGQSKETWIDGHTGTKQIDLPAENLNRVYLDEKGLSMDINTNNNSINVKRPLKFVPGLKLDDGRYKELYFLPTLAYNTSDGGQLGMVFFNSTFPGKKLKWALSPAYAFGSSKLVGEGWISYDHYLNSKKFRKLQYKLNAKSYSYFYSKTLDTALSFTRISPQISLHFKHEAAAHKYSKLYFKPIFLNEEYFVFNDEDVSVENRNSTIYRVGFEQYNFWELGPSDIIANLEYQPYTNEIGESHNYLKLTAAYSKSFFYAPTRSVDFRIWTAYFISNTQRESPSYDPSLVRGSAALIYQGFNDYAYDDYFFNRANQGVRLDNQIGYLGGGFKTPFGSQYSIGQTNDFAFAINMKSNLPIKTPRFLPLKLFLDVGYYTGKETAEEELEGRSFYSGGVMLEFGEGLFSIYLPLINSQAISDIYETEGTNLLGRVSFRMDLVRFNPWDIAEDFSF